MLKPEVSTWKASVVRICQRGRAKHSDWTGSVVNRGVKDGLKSAAETWFEETHQVQEVSVVMRIEGGGRAYVGRVHLAALVEGDVETCEEVAC